MDQDIQSQIDRANELLQELEKACNNDLQAKNVSGKTKNLSQEILLKIKHLLDQSFYKFFEKHYLPSLSKPDKDTARIYFPVIPKKEDFKSVLGRAKMSDLETRHHDFYAFIESIQPYNQGCAWIKDLASLASEKHTRLTPQTKIETRRVTVSSGNGSVSWGSGVTFGNGVSVMGVPINPITQMPVQNNIAETKVENWVSFLFEGTDVNVLFLCKKSVEEGEKIVKKILEFV